MVTGIDWMGLAARDELSGLPVQRDARTDELVTAVAQQAAAAPQATDIGRGIETVLFAWDDIEPGATVLAALWRAVLSEYGYAWAGGTDGAGEGEVLTFRSRLARRRARIAGTVDAVIVRAAGMEFSRATTAELLRAARVGIRQRRVDDMATNVLGRAERSIEIPQAGEIDVRLPYRDPEQEAERVSGVDMVAPVADVDYVGASLDGTPMTAALDVQPTFAAQHADLRVRNTGSETVEVTDLQVRGRGLYRFRQLFLVAHVNDDAREVLTLELPYLEQVSVAQGIADQIARQYGAPLTRCTAVALHAARDTAPTRGWPAPSTWTAPSKCETRRPPCRRISTCSASSSAPRRRTTCA